jgi:methionine-gamma-lyase
MAVHCGREDLDLLGVHALPIDLSSTSPLPDLEQGGGSYESMAAGGYPLPNGGAVYARLWNSTVARFETALAALEHASTAVAYSSGMAAMTAAIMASTAFSGRRHVIAVRPLYGGTDHLLASGLLGVEVTFCAEHEIAASIRPDTALVIVETPANPTLELVDIADVVEQAGEVPVLVDNTFATPVLQNPITLGARMALHSATKYLGGHGDVVGGVIACDEQTAANLRRVRAVTGGLLHPLGAYLLHRGLATLPTRVRAQQATAQRIAAWLRTHPAVNAVYYPGMDGDPQSLLRRQMRGTGAMIAISLRGGYAAARNITSSAELFTHAVSLGGVDSLIQHPAALTHRPVAPHARPSTDIVRLSIGLEDANDLIADLDRALTGLSSNRTIRDVPEPLLGSGRNGVRRRLTLHRHHRSASNGPVHVGGAQ